MASLRRPSMAVRPGQPVPGTRPPMPEGGKEKRRDARKSRVGDAIKKRMSMRYAGPEQLFASPAPLPGQPSTFLTQDPYGGFPSTGQDRIIEEDEGQDDDDVGESQFGQFASPVFQSQGLGQRQPAGRPGIRREDTIARRGAADTTVLEEWDMDELGKDGVDIQGWMRKTLKGADEDEIKRFKAALMRSKQQNAKELQRNVFKNYAEFVAISKEISTLENDMLELKELLSEWKDLPKLMGMDDTLAPVVDKDGRAERRRTQRNSMADLQQLYKSQLTNLWSTVEGSQKFLPAVPGRHLVHETHSFVELNPATYKAKQSVSLFLLNDLLLIAGRRRIKTGTQAGLVEHGERDERDRSRMVAERCWVLADLVVVDVKDSGDLTNALKIRRSKETCVYRTGRAEDKKALLAAFRQVSQELGERKRKENEREQERRKSMWTGDMSLSSAGAITPSVPGLLSPDGRPISTAGLSVADSKDYRWIDDCGGELCKAIATRDWEAAVAAVERSEQLLQTVANNATAQSLLSERLEQLRPTLVSQLAHDLSSTELRRTATSRLVALLSRLNHQDLAQETFLKTRREIMLRRVRGIRCEGDTSIYVSELAIVCFTVIRHTSDWYMTAFKENRMASGFVTWAKEQIETFADLFRRQVYAPSIEGDVADECIRVIASHNRKLLRDVGLDFTFLLSTLLQPPSTSSDPHPHPHPVFNLPAGAATPAGGFHIEPSPFPGYNNDEGYFNDADVDVSTPSLPAGGGTAPLSIGRKAKNDAPRGPRSNGADSGNPDRPSSPNPPARSALRGGRAGSSGPEAGTGTPNLTVPYTLGETGRSKSHGSSSGHEDLR